MQLTQLRIILITTLGLLFLGACSSSNQALTRSSGPPTESQPTTPSSPTVSTEKTIAAKPDSHSGQGGQIIESGPYHLELLTSEEAGGTHIDLFLQKGDNHEPIPNAKVTAKVQLPDGSQKTLDMKYDTFAKHYHTLLPGTATGEYKIVILSNIQGEKVNARYTFKR
ncbi:MAG: hypothetical protein K6T90_13490 [Leptolyngbyaceae cyanobacterium HOT.MB2.61]|nr:hypothetical protein [Leptolyngbyaceae cyanobacterium HOT.MB2.61]